MRRLVRVCLAAGFGALAPGCVLPPNVPPAPVKREDQITLLALPAALNWDNEPGPDGVQTIVHLFRRAPAQPVLATGKLEFLLYEGRISQDELPHAEPFHIWPFTAADLEPYMGRSKAGWGYALRLPWGPRAPRSGSITLVARYTPLGAREPTVYSAPTIIAMKSK